MPGPGVLGHLSPTHGLSRFQTHAQNSGSKTMTLTSKPFLQRMMRKKEATSHRGISFAARK